MVREGDDIAQALASLRGLAPAGRPFQLRTPLEIDEARWFNRALAEGLVVITRDQRIRYRPVEKRMWVQHRVRGFVLTGTASQSTADSLRLLEQSWTKMATIVDATPAGPWMYAITQAGLRAILLG